VLTLLAVRALTNTWFYRRVDFERDSLIKFVLDGRWLFCAFTGVIHLFWLLIESTIKRNHESLQVGDKLAENRMNSFWVQSIRGSQLLLKLTQLSNRSHQWRIRSLLIQFRLGNLCLNLRCLDRLNWLLSLLKILLQLILDVVHLWYNILVTVYQSVFKSRWVSL